MEKAQELKMRVGFDRQSFIVQKHGGISRYFSDLYMGLLQRHDVEAELLFKRHQNAYLADAGVGQKLHSLAAKAYIKALTKSNCLLPLARRQDIHHATYYLGKPKKSRRNVKLVTTLFDMIPELFPSFFKGEAHANKLAWFNASDLIISISDSAAADLAYFQPQLAGRIRRVHLYSGFSSGSRQVRPAALGQKSKPYVLFVGSRGAYKNTAMLIRAFAASKPRRHGHRLVFAGGGALRREEISDIARLGIADQVQQLDVNDAELWYLYLNAVAILVPSLAEGFSLPLVEGLAANVPVVCSDIPVHREVAGSYATLVNPLLHQDWADIMRSISNLRKPSEVLGEKCLKDRRGYFSRERMVAEHVNAYSDMLS
jgi:glycosyltransferase involved in cell wall biosynthesis